MSDILAAIGFCLYGGMCQIRWLPQVSASMEVCVRYAGCHLPVEYAVNLIRSNLNLIKANYYIIYNTWYWPSYQFCYEGFGLGYG